MGARVSAPHRQSRNWTTNGQSFIVRRVTISGSVTDTVKHSRVDAERERTRKQRTGFESKYFTEGWVWAQYMSAQSKVTSRLECVNWEEFRCSVKSVIVCNCVYVWVNSFSIHSVITVIPVLLC